MTTQTAYQHLSDAARQRFLDLAEASNKVTRLTSTDPTPAGLVRFIPGAETGIEFAATQLVWNILLNRVLAG